ncbi:MAG TPA: hypothetical protein VN886_17925 [Acidimicrobiales bacterium]|nr:hypothetical protein [Acidimicrobiales bacterium]
MESQLLGVTEVAALVDLCRQRILRLIESGPTFQKPAAQLARGRVWRRGDVEEWARAMRRDVVKE